MTLVVVQMKQDIYRENRKILTRIISLMRTACLYDIGENGEESLDSNISKVFGNKGSHYFGF